MEGDEITIENDEKYYTNRVIVYLNVALTSFVVFLYTIYLLLPRPKRVENEKYAKSD